MDTRVVRRNDWESANQPIPQPLMIALFVEMRQVCWRRSNFAPSGGAAENLDWLSDDSKAPTVLDRAEKA